MRAFLTILAALSAILSTPAMAWGALGHRTVGAIAMANVKPGTRAAITQLLHHQRELDTPKCSMRTIEDAATWPDCIKSEQWRWAYANSWHYHDQPICGTFNLKAHCRDGMCATAQIERDARLLADRKLAPVLRLEALSFLVHFVGDIHQPLHVGENEDMGGNAVKADYGIAPGRNLHSIWDGVLAERAITSAPTLVRRYSAGEKASLATGTLEDWERESWQISRDFLYPLAFGGKLPCADGRDVKEPQKIIWSNEAIEQAIPIIDQRIERAGLRLAKMLDAALG
ncbi:S1/P1 nuclease [Novosphingobium sp. P6W]|uniref:S1/P1 nuclease n=1 Tax=Novosphingobium sp. P6W TaxID=1609758 RepID=UPI0005C30709|nr:S1/P1 nuclease [Novosphingobium sp. P6W]AXB75753.1 endonuclease [Novosphingobium sp. P6W]KIS33035.1 endonuclease [Novosphingobium sp. P6W]